MPTLRVRSMVVSIRFCCEYILFFLLGSAIAIASESTDFSRHHAYIGVEGGYGSTTWNGLVPTAEKQNLALSFSTPIHVDEGGGVVGGFLGYEFTPFFALEGNYLLYPDATVFFDQDSLFTFENGGRTQLTTHTEMLSIMAKIMMYVPQTTTWRLYSSVGLGEVHRRDEINDEWLAVPSFSVGLNHHFNPRVMGEVVANYTAGYGESELSPVQDYVPFLYSVALRLAYTFG